MKPNFALSLSVEGIRLLHRGAGGWNRVGVVPLDSDDLVSDLARLRRDALALAPEGIRCKLLIPNDQIRFLALDDGADDAMVRAALKGATPYAVDDLAYDFRSTGTVTQVAAVARETLDEAEAFALEHDLGPVAFAAIPEDGLYDGEAFFGASAAVTTLLPAGDSVERDAEPTVEAAPQIDELPLAVAAPTPAPENDPEPAPSAPTGPRTALPDADPTDDAAWAKPAAMPAAPVAEPVSAPVAAEKTDAAPPVAAAPAAATAEDSTPAAPEAVPGSDRPDEVFAGETPAARNDIAEPEAPAEPDSIADQAGADDHKPAAAASADLAIAGASVMPDLPQAAPGAAEALAASDAPGAGKAVAEMAEASAAQPRRGAVPVPPPGTPPPPPQRPRPVDVSIEPLLAPAALGSRLDGFDRPDLGLEPRTAPRVGLIREGDGPEGRKIMPPAVPRPSAPPAAMPPVPEPAHDPLDPDAAARAAAATLSAPDPVSGTGTGPATAQAPLVSQRRGSDATAPRGGASKPRLGGDGAIGGKPRALGLILTLVLIAVIALVALWATTLEGNPIARLFGAEPVETAAPVIPETEDPTIAEADAEAEAEADVALADPYDEASYPPPEQSSGVAVSPAEAERVYAATGVWLRAPRLPLVPRSDSVGDPVAAEPRGSVEIAAPSLMPVRPSAGPDGNLMPQRDPPAPGTVFERDARGFIAATPEGTLSPEGIAIYAGSPDLLPPTRPGTKAPVDPDVSVGSTAKAADPAATSDLEATLAEAIEQTPQTAVDPATADPATGVATPEAAVDAASGPDTAPEAVDLVPGAPPVVPPSRPSEAAAINAATATTGGDVEVTPGAPPVTPPNRPSTGVFEAAAASASDDPAAEAETTPGAVGLDGLRDDSAAEAVARFAGPRPSGRPAGLAPETPADVTELAETEAEAGAETPVVEAPPPATVADALASIMAGAPDPLANATVRAVPVAPRPGSRPQNFARVVAQARTAPAAVAPSQPAAAPTQVANATVAPTGPVPTGVAQAATRDSAINLRDINLIGVYGRPNARRALVRLDNGRYLRVAVGDSLDGGQVTAIGDDVLNYVKRGRTLVLQIPE